MNTPKTNKAALASNIKMVNHKFCLVMGKNIHPIELANNVMGWVKDIVEFIKPHNTLTSPQEMFEMLKLTKEVSDQIKSIETKDQFVYITDRDV
jgi:hypothetical protein